MIDYFDSEGDYREHLESDLTRLLDEKSRLDELLLNCTHDEYEDFIDMKEYTDQQIITTRSLIDKLNRGIK